MATRSVSRVPARARLAAGDCWSAALLWAAALLALALSGSSQAQNAGADLGDIQAQVAEALGVSRAGAFYAANVNFTVNPDIATAFFEVDVPTDFGIPAPELRNTRVPLRYNWEREGRQWQPFVQGVIGYLDLSAAFDLLPGAEESVESNWRTRGFSVSTGVEYALNERWTLIPAVDLGWAEVRNKADYQGPLGQDLFRPLLEGVLFDWEAQARVTGATLGARYNRTFSRFRMHGTASVSANHVESFDASSRFIDFASDVRTLDWELNTIHPLPFQAARYPVELVTIIGGSRFVGGDADSLGFDRFWEAGAAVQFDLSERRWAIDGVRLGFKGIFGDGVSGWAVVLGKQL